MAAVKARIVVRRAAALVLGVLALHVWLLQQMPWPAQGRPTPQIAAAMMLRPVPAAAATPATEPVPVPRAPPAERTAEVSPGTGASNRVPANLDPFELPVYPVRLPPPLHWRYAVHRASGSGTAQWDWQPQGVRFESRLAAQGPEGRPWFEWTSRGTLEADGVAPERFVDRRGGRAGQAANFDRAAGRIGYSGPSAQSPLPPGAQDRLSWVAQVAGVVAAEPARWAPGSELRLYVSGARGDAEVWRFQVEGLQPVALADGGPVRALKLLREPEGRYGTRVEVWLDPGRGFAPVRVLWRNGEAFTELVLQP